MNIVLIGPRGSGKTEVAKVLARGLKMKLIEMDRLITKKAGMSIPEIVRNYGWDRFRDIESEVAEEIADLDDCIIDTGGGVVSRQRNVDNLRKNGIVILLMADVETLVNRIKDDMERPSLTRRKSFTEEMEDVLRARREKYVSAADYTIDTSKLALEQVAERAIEWLRQQVVS